MQWFLQLLIAIAKIDYFVRGYKIATFWFYRFFDIYEPEFLQVEGSTFY